MRRTSPANHQRITALVLAALAVGVLPRCGDAGESATDACPAGSEDCPCTDDGSCDSGLECLSMLCVEESPSVSGSTSTGGVPPSTGSSSTDDTGAGTGTETDPVTGSSSASDTDDCPVGAEGCACADGGACDEGLSCQEEVCTCLETDEEFCASVNAVCGVVVGTDGCGNMRRVTCGDCGSAACDEESHHCIPTCADVSIDDGFLEDNVDNGNWQPVADVNNTEHDLFVTATPDLQVIISFQAAQGCSDRALRVFEFIDGSYVASDISEDFAGQLYFEEHTMTITPDGGALIGMSPDRARLVVADRALLQGGDADAVDEDPTLLSDINGDAVMKSASFDAPLLSPDGLALYYLLTGGGDGCSPESDGEELSDAATDSATSSGASSSAASNAGETSGAQAVCGDGALDPGEECDDGNNDELDGCSAECLEGAAVLWCKTNVGPADVELRTTSVASGPAGEVVISSHTGIGSGERSELLVLGAEGALTKSFSTDAYAVEDVVVGVDGNIATFGCQSYFSDFDDTRFLMTLVSPEGQLIRVNETNNRCEWLHGRMSPHPDGFVAAWGAGGLLDYSVIVVRWMTNSLDFSASAQLEGVDVTAVASDVDGTTLVAVIDDDGVGEFPALHAFTAAGEPLWSREPVGPGGTVAIVDLEPRFGGFIALLQTETGWSSARINPETGEWSYNFVVTADELTAPFEIAVVDDLTDNSLVIAGLLNEQPRLVTRDDGGTLVEAIALPVDGALAADEVALTRRSSDGVMIVAGRTKPDHEAWVCAIAPPPSR